MNVEEPCGVGGRFGARRHHRNNFILLIGSEFWTTASDAALPTGSIQSSLGSFAEYRSFELGKCSDHLHHHTPRSSGRINRFRQAPESGSASLIRSMIIRRSRRERESLSRHSCEVVGCCIQRLLPSVSSRQTKPIRGSVRLLFSTTDIKLNGNGRTSTA
jgi:hypothetical protein